jgi:hypothetical protein
MTATSANPPFRLIAAPAHFISDIYSFKWAELSFRLPLISALAVAVCLFAGILAGHPGGGLIAGGGAFTIGFGANQRIADSRLIPMMAAVFACSTATLAGTLAGHRNFWLIVAAGGSALIYGLLTTRNTGLSWVGQQASVALLVASAFPTGPVAALERAALIAGGGIVQILITSAGLSLVPNLRKDLATLASSVFNSARDPDGDLIRRFRHIPQVLPAFSTSAAFAYSIRLVITMSVATEVYRQLGIQSGYWIPMTALLVQKPALSETVTRATARILGTLAGAWLGSLLVAHVTLSTPVLALMATVFALLAFATNSVNYGLFTACLTAYIVFLLSLNQIPGPVIAHRRAWCTILGGLIALVIHLDALHRHRAANAVSA